MAEGTQKNIYDLIGHAPKKPVKSQRLFFPDTVVCVTIIQYVSITN